MDDENQRLSSDDVTRVRFRVDGETRSETPPVTIVDLAEALGVEPAVVREHLDRVRAETAFATPVSKSKSQRGMLLLALSLLATAGVVYRVSPHPLTESDIDEKVAESRTRWADRAKHSARQLDNTLSLGAKGPPAGINIDVTGPRTHTRVLGSANPDFPTAEQASERLRVAILEVVKFAQQAEKEAPTVTNSELNDPRRGLGQFGPNSLRISAGTSFLSLETTDVTNPERIRQFSKEAIAAEVAQQARQNDGASRPLTAVDQYESPPSGYTIDVKGRGAQSQLSSTLVIVPVDAVSYAARIRRIVKRLLLKDMTGERTGFAVYDDKDKRKPIPAFTHVKITGPLSVTEFDVPTNHSDRYKTAADAARAATGIIEENLKRVDVELRELNKGAGR